MKAVSHALPAGALIVVAGVSLLLRFRPAAAEIDSRAPARQPAAAESSGDSEWWRAGVEVITTAEAAALRTEVEGLLRRRRLSNESPNLERAEYMLRDLQRVAPAELAVLYELRARGVWPLVRLRPETGGSAHVVAIDFGGEMASRELERRIEGGTDPKPLNRDVDDTVMSSLRRLPELEAVSLVDTRITDDGLQALLGLKNLRYLWLPPGATDRGLASLARSGKLEHLNLLGCAHISGEGFAAWRSHRRLATVHAAYPANPERVLALLAKAPAIKSILWARQRDLLAAADGTRIQPHAPSPEPIVQVAAVDLKHPASFWWPDTEVLCESDLDNAWLHMPPRLPARSPAKSSWRGGLDDYPSLQNLPEAERAVLHQLRARGIRPRVKLGRAPDGETRVVAIDLARATDLASNRPHRAESPGDRDPLVGDSAMPLVARLPALQAVFLCGTEITDAGLEPLQQLKDLRYAWLPPRATDGGLSRLAHVASIEHLSLYGCREISGEGLAAWKTHPRLTSVKAAYPANQQSLVVSLQHVPAIQAVLWQEGANLLNELLPELRPPDPSHPTPSRPPYGVTPEWMPDRKAILLEDLDHVFALWERRQENARRRNVTKPEAFAAPQELRDFFALQAVPSGERRALQQLIELNIRPWIHVGPGTDGNPHVVAIDLTGRMNSISGPEWPTYPINDEAMVWIAQLPELQAAILCQTGITDAGLVRLLDLKNLRYVWLPPNTTDEALDHLASLSTIEHLNLHGCHYVTSDGFTRWRGHPNLSALQTAMRDLRHALPALESAPRFRGLARGAPRASSMWTADFAWRPDTDVIAADEIEEFRNQMEEFAERTGRENGGVRKALADFQVLTALPAGERAALNRLRALGMRPRVKLGRDANGPPHVVALDVNGGAFRHGGEFEYREHAFRQKQPGNEAMAWVAQLPRLQALFLHDATVDDAGLRALLDLRELRHLRLQAPVTDEGLARLAQLRSIEHLDLDGWAGAGSGFAVWRDHPRLASVNLAAHGGHGLSLEHLRALLLARPNVQVAMGGSLDRTASWMSIVPWLPDTVVLSDADIDAFRNNRLPPLPPEMNPGYFLNRQQAEAHYAALQALSADERAALHALREQNVWPHVKLERDAAGLLRVVALGFRGAAYFRAREERATDAVMPTIARLTKLQALILYNELMSEGSVITTVRSLQDLRYLWPPWEVGDAGLAELAANPSIEHLNLRECGKITGEGLAAWRDHPRLSTVRLHPGIEKSRLPLQLLKGAPRLWMIFDEQNLLAAEADLNGIR